jgi:precorrin-3B synthase
MTSVSPRGACPGLSAPILTGDGLLARFTPSDRIALGSFIAFCTAAGRHGNGTVEITARGSFQVRGLSAASAGRFASEIAALDVAAIEGVPVIVDPLPDGPDALVDAAELAVRLRWAIGDTQLVLAPKVCVIIDSGGRLHLDALAADVRLCAIGTAQAPRFYVAVGGTAATAKPLGSIAPDTAVTALLRILSLIAARGCTGRAADILESEGIEVFHSVLDDDIETCPRPQPRAMADPIGRHPLRDGSIALGIALPFGQAHADALARLAQAAAAFGVRALRPAPDRALLLIGVCEESAVPLTATAERLGFIVHTDDPRRRIVACPGKPACASGLIAARALAADLARHLSAHGDAVHISGCSKGCAHPAAAALTVVGTERGCGIVRHGSASATPNYHVEPAKLVVEIVRIVEPGEAVHA